MIITLPDSDEAGPVLLPDVEEMRQMASLLFHGPEAFGLIATYCGVARAIIAGEFLTALSGREPGSSVIAIDSHDRIAAYRKYWCAMKFEIL